MKRRVRLKLKAIENKKKDTWFEVGKGGATKDVILETDWVKIIDRSPDSSWFLIESK